VQRKPELAELLDLTGRVALVTGAGQGIGAETAHMLAAQGAAIAVNDYFAERAVEVAAAIEQAGGLAHAVAADIADRASVRALVAEIELELGPVDILVNNAGNAGATHDGLARLPQFWEQDPADWQPWIAVNYLGVMYATHAVLGGMVAREHGRVITVISEAARVGEPDLVVYSGAKAGAAGFMRAVAKAVGRHGVTANCVALGATRTPAIEPALADEAVRARLVRPYPLGRLGEPADAAALITFLATGAASWITAQTYPVNGGFSVSC
jgi:3-oxoacyl-[acyl-carrier protein] reductase